MSRKIKRIASAAGFVTYLRTSDEDVQSPVRSQDAQRRDIRHRLLTTYTLPALGEYIDNFTGTSADRKNYQRMLADARLGKFSHVFASTPDRFGRDDVEALRTIDELTRLGVVVRFATHPDLDPANEDDRMYLGILFGMAKRESAVTARRVRGGMTSKLLKGGWTWRAPDGYRNRDMPLTELSMEERLNHAQRKKWVEIDPEQAKVWRLAWDLLLTDRYSLEDICRALHEQGYKMANGRPFVEVRRNPSNPTPKTIAYIQTLSRAFHNWFYAGWVNVQNDWVNIAPKTVKGEWEPIVSTDEFERGLAILANRLTRPMPNKRHFYLLKGLIYLSTDGGLRKLVCSKPNANRQRGGVSYYCILSSNLNFLCRPIDEQVIEHVRAIQVSPDLLPQIRTAYLADVSRYTKDLSRERKALETRQRKLDEKELNLWRAFTDHGMRAQIYERLTKECQDERQKLEVLAKRMAAEQADYVANLDAALHILSEIGERYEKCSPSQQRDILLQMVERVIITAEGQIQQIEWKSPFCYIQSIRDAKSGLRKPSQSTRRTRTNRTSQDDPIGSIQNSLRAPNRNRTAKLFSSLCSQQFNLKGPCVW